MKHLVILGAGTGGTIMAHRLRRELPEHAWTITVVDRDERHFYQPGFIFIPFGTYTPDEVVRPKRDLLPDGVDFVVADVDRVEPEAHRVALADGRALDYDLLLVATGTEIRPDETPGLDGALWRRDAFDFYTFEGSVALRDKLATWEGGTLTIALAESIFKCPVAPLEFAFLADAFFEKRGIRDRVQIRYVTPLSGAFTKPKATAMLSRLLAEKGITVVPDFYTERVDEERKTLVSYDGREEPFDLLVAVPVNKGAAWVERSGMGDDDGLGFIPTDKHTLQARVHPDIFVIGDATNVPTSKAGSVVHFESEVLVENLVAHAEGRPLPARYDGHANCFIETGHGKATLVDFNYTTEPLPGHFPMAVLGPMSLLKETRLNHAGKMAFKWVYWNLLLPGRPLPVSTELSMTGKYADDVAV